MTPTEFANLQARLGELKRSREALGQQASNINGEIAAHSGAIAEYEKLIAGAEVIDPPPPLAELFEGKATEPESGKGSA